MLEGLSHKENFALPEKFLAMLADFHAHTVLSDGTLSVMELISRAFAAGYSHLGITDHAGIGNLQRLIEETRQDCELVRAFWPIEAIWGVELTHLPAGAIDGAARKAKELGARLVLVHGETPVEPVEAGTNRAAIESAWVDVLAHPGLLTHEEGLMAARNGTFIEISSRRGHCLGNGNVVRVARETGAFLIIDSDTHSSGDLLNTDMIRKVGLGAGLTEEELRLITEENPLKLLGRLNTGAIETL